MPFNFEITILGYGLGVMTDGPDMYSQPEGGFGMMRSILPTWGLGAKNGPKTENLKIFDKA